MQLSRRICFIASDTRFFFRHFRPAILAALSRKLKILAFLPTGLPSSDVLQQNVQIILSPLSRDTLTVKGLFRQTMWLIKHVRRERPEIVVAFSLKTSLVLALALPFVSVKKAIIYVTGLGLLQLLSDKKSIMSRKLAYWILRTTSRRKNCYFIFENCSDPTSMGFKPGNPKRKTLLVGAGIDEIEFNAGDFPPPKPLKFASVSRLVWSKGIDLAAQAVSELVAEGYAIELNIYGAKDAANPRSVAPSTLAHLPGVFFRGHTDDVAEVWKQHHAGVFASRGGEGVPRSLLEAAACGRPCIVTDVPGCADFIRDGIEGYVAKANSVASLKAAFLKLMAEPENLSALGQAARERVLQLSTARIVQQQYEELFDQRCF